MIRFHMIKVWSILAIQKYGVSKSTVRAPKVVVLLQWAEFQESRGHPLSSSNISKIK